MSVERVPFDDPDATALRLELEADSVALYGEDSEPGQKPSVANTPVFLVARLDGEAVGCGALRRAGDDAWEIKRMYVRPAARRRGVASALLRALEEEARARGAARIVLETGDLQIEAVAMYEAAGYRRLDAAGAHPRSVCFEKKTRS